ncbi:energy-coupling factor ABC transporter ATP-binding protein [Vagococcus acidifermentans]|uniref:ABC transporter ATP-binding protein n=1 Tax=Vagococcus acidifermentans TaxID=564710 RepID=A0A430AWZ4_9ENTE|nr:ABC transporter ATP-binding protein [Vagococcus acidifermentans]RSU12574.1 ABC transporter ATP-binding protein [Vagococcus acidifermentans]
MSFLSLSKVSYTYPLEEKEAVHNLSFEFEKGKVYGILGANEAGKTTMCHIIRGFIPSFYKGKLEGDIRLKNKQLDEYKEGELASIIGYSFQNPFTQISGVKETVYEEIAYGMENLGFPRQEMIAKVEELIDLFKLADLQDKNPFELSGGQKQRVALASIVALNPEIIILDEPTSQLDPQSTEEIFSVIDLLKHQGKTVILVEHKVDLLAEYCDEIILMADGEIVLSGDVKSVLSNPEVLKHGGQLPQVTRFFLEAMAQEKLKKEKRLPLTLDEAYAKLREEVK